MAALQKTLPVPAASRTCCHIPYVVSCRPKHGRRPLSTVAAKKDEGAASVLSDVGKILGSTVSVLAGKTGTKPTQKSTPADDWNSPVYGLIAVNAAVFLLANIMHLLPLGPLQLQLKQFAWWQVISSCFIHTNFNHLAETTFLIYTFGRLVERTAGVWGLWATYLASAIGANLFVLWMFPSKAVVQAVASSAGVVGLFVVGLLLPRLHRKPLEVACLAPFVWLASVERYQGLAAALVVDGARIGHLVHVTGAVLAACCVAGIFKIINMVQEVLEKQQQERERQARLQRQKEQQDGSVDEAVAEVLNNAAKAATHIAKKLL